jgi:hypothetical protein
MVFASTVRRSYCDPKKVAKRLRVSKKYGG